MKNIRALLIFLAAAACLPTMAQEALTGTVLDEQSEPIIGATVQIPGTGKGVLTDIDGHFTLKEVLKGDIIKITCMGFRAYEQAWDGNSSLRVVLVDESKTMSEVVVTAMGIMRKEKSLTYATQMVKGEDIMRVEDPNFVNALEGKVAGMTLTPSAGGAGGATKILLRGNKSILGSNTPLIVVDGIPMSNGVTGQVGVNGGESLTYANTSEGSDPLSEINPDDIESINVLKGANAAALYGSKAANGVVMITTKKGKEGKIGVTFNSNITFETPLLTPEIQNIYGAQVNTATGMMGTDSWGKRLSDLTPEELAFTGTYGNVHLRSAAGDDVADFFQTGITTNNAISVSGGTQKIKSYFSYANSHSEGMVPDNNYNRHTVAFRQTYDLLKDYLHIDVSLNYVQAKTKNRPGGGTVLNPLYDLYTTPRNVDMTWYRNNYGSQGAWTAIAQGHYKDNGAGGYDWVSEDVPLTGLHQNWWAYEAAGLNNPYWLTQQNTSTVQDDRVYGYVSGRLHIWDGFYLQARLSIDHTKYTGEYCRYATTENVAAMEYYGTYGQDIYKTNEVYTDYLLSYDKVFAKDYSVSATAGFVGHTIQGTTQKLWQTATETDGRLIILPTAINYFSPSISNHATSYSETSNWDKAAIFTGQFGWKESVFVEGSYRQDWYRAFKQFAHRGTPDSYGYFSVGANAILSNLIRMPEWFNYAKVRLSYSEVGNSIPNILYSNVRSSTLTGATSVSNYVINDPRPEKTQSTEAGFDLAFFRNALTLDLTYYNQTLGNAYIETGSTGGKTIVTNTARIRNSGIELTLGYNLLTRSGFGWRSSLNFSWNKNKILDTYTDPNGTTADIEKKIANGKVSVIYKKGGEYGDMYARDFDRNDDGTIYVNPDDGSVSLSKNMTYVGNMNAKYQLGWSNTFTYKNFSLYFLISGKIGGKVISFTEAYLDRQGNSQRSADAREAAIQNGWYWKKPILDEQDRVVGYEQTDQPAMLLPDGVTWAPVEAYYKSIGGDVNATQYIYDATNFRLRELSLGYTFKNLFGADKDLSLSFVARNLFFIYRDAPVDPDVALSTQNSLNAFEIFNMPSARSYGFNLKLNF